MYPCMRVYVCVFVCVHAEEDGGNFERSSRIARDVARTQNGLRSERHVSVRIDFQIPSTRTVPRIPVATKPRAPHPHFVAIVYNDLRSSNALPSDAEVSSSCNELTESVVFSDLLTIPAELSVVVRNLRLFLLRNVVTGGSVNVAADDGLLARVV